MSRKSYDSEFEALDEFTENELEDPIDENDVESNSNDDEPGEEEDSNIPVGDRAVYMVPGPQPKSLDNKSPFQVIRCTVGKMGYDSKKDPMGWLFSEIDFANRFLPDRVAKEVMKIVNDTGYQAFDRNSILKFQELGLSPSTISIIVMTQIRRLNVYHRLLADVNAVAKSGVKETIHRYVDTILDHHEKMESEGKFADVASHNGSFPVFLNANCLWKIKHTMQNPYHDSSKLRECLSIDYAIANRSGRNGSAECMIIMKDGMYCGHAYAYISPAEKTLVVDGFRLDPFSGSKETIFMLLYGIMNTAQACNISRVGFLPVFDEMFGAELTEIVQRIDATKTSTKIRQHDGAIELTTVEIGSSLLMARHTHKTAFNGKITSIDVDWQDAKSTFKQREPYPWKFIKLSTEGWKKPKTLKKK